MTDTSDPDFHDFHLKAMPQRLATGRGLQAAIAARELPPICFRLYNTDNAYTYRPQPYSIDIVAGTETAIVINLSYVDWRRMVIGGCVVSELLDGVEINGVEIEGDDSQEIVGRWIPVLRAMFHG